jgi:hypothetical protein
MKIMNDTVMQQDIKSSPYKKKTNGLLIIFSFPLQVIKGIFAGPDNKFPGSSQKMMFNMSKKMTNLLKKHFRIEAFQINFLATVMAIFTGHLCTAIKAISQNERIYCNIN